jgi:hypothetical protein
MRWFRSHRCRIAWLACFALACQLVLSFGHIHVGQLSNGTFVTSVFVGHDAASDNPAQPAPKNSSGAIDGYCAVCRNIDLTSTLIAPILAALILPHFFDQSLPWPPQQAEPSRLAHSDFQARAPPEA